MVESNGWANGEAPSSSLVEGYVGMGFTKDMVIKAIKKIGHSDADALLELLLTYMTSGLIPQSVEDDDDLDFENWDGDDDADGKEPNSDGSGDEVNIAEEAVRRVTGTNLLFSTPSDMPGTSSSAPFSSCVSDAASADAAPSEENMSHFLQGLLEDSQIRPDLPEAVTPALTGEEMGPRPASMRRVASLESLQKRIHGDPVHHEAAPSTFSDMRSLPMLSNWLKS